MRIFLDEEQAQITTVPQNLLHITLSNGQTWDNVEARRLFPMNDPWHYISLLNEENEEVAIIRDIQALPPASRDAVMHVLGEYYMFPVITKIYRMSGRKGRISFSVSTNRGDFRFEVRHPHANIKTLSGHRVLLRDSNDNRYEIPDVTQLDERSQKLINTEL